MITRDGGHLALGIWVGVSASLLLFVVISKVGLIVFSPEIFAAIVGGFLAGTFGVAATVISLIHSASEKKQEGRARDEATMHAIVTKLIDLNDFIIKQRRHVLTDSKETRVYFEVGGTLHSFSKPLEGKHRHIEFTTEERGFLLRAGGANYFNDISDVQGISDNADFLTAHHKKAYYEVYKEMTSKDISRQGYQLEGGVVSDSPNLLAIMDADGAMRTFLLDAVPRTSEVLEKMISFSNAVTSVRIGYSETDASPSVANTERRDY